VSENRVLRRIFAPKGSEVTGEEIHDLYSSPSIIRMIRVYSRNGEKINSYRLLVGNLEGRRPL
jgi:hypothetical protein